MMANIDKRIKRNTDVRREVMDRGLYEEFARIAHIRFINGLDRRPSPPRVQKKVLRHPLWGKIRDDLKIADFVEDEKGQGSVFNIFTFIIVALVAVVFFAGLIYVQGLMYNVLHDVGVANDASGSGLKVNMTYAADATFGVVNQSIQSLRMVAMVYLMCMAVTIIITNALMKVHPLFFFVYILIVLLAVIFAAPISNAYYTLVNSDIYGGDLLPSFTGANWVLYNLPLITLIIGILGGIFLFINILRTEPEVSQLR